MVQFVDGSIKAQMGLPDMRLPILYAMGYPARIHGNLPRIDFTEYSKLTFEKPDQELFYNLKLAYHALDQGGNVPCIMNAANEVAVEAFLQDRISFLSMSHVIEHCMQQLPFIPKPGYDDYVHTHNNTVIVAREFINKQNSHHS
jgi:1-deoxy-D-xylulose-5-phosphate reductoisomerase